MLVSDRRQIKSSRDDASVPTKGVRHALSPTDVAPGIWNCELVRDECPERIMKHKEHCSVVMPLGRQHMLLGHTMVCGGPHSKPASAIASPQHVPCVHSGGCVVVQMHLIGEDPWPASEVHDSIARAMAEASAGTVSVAGVRQVAIQQGLSATPMAMQRSHNRGLVPPVHLAMPLPSSLCSPRGLKCCSACRWSWLPLARGPTTTGCTSGSGSIGGAESISRG